MGDGWSALHHQSAAVQSDECLPTRVISPYPLPNAYPPPWPYCFFLLLPFFHLPFPSCSFSSSSSPPYLPLPSLLLPLSSIFLFSLSSSSSLLPLLFLVFLFFHFFSFSSYSSSFLLSLFLLFLFFLSSAIAASRLRRLQLPQGLQSNSIKERWLMRLGGDLRQ